MFRIGNIEIKSIPLAVVSETSLVGCCLLGINSGCIVTLKTLK